jgi:dihydrofolate synthase / folylpolyglutamate synthase
MNYQESLDYIKSLTPTLERPTMARIKLYFEELGEPQNKLPCWHVGGTNGKGSVTTFIASMLGACGLKVGKFTGPHLIKFNERIVIDGRDVSDERFAALASTVFTQSAAFAERHPQLGPLTWFEFLTAMAVQYFSEEKVDYAVFEVGLGGRFDATNALENIVVSTITNIDLDHMHLLGDTVEKIAAEKAGIIKGAPLVTAAGGAALEVLRARAKQENSPTVILKTPGGAYSANLFQEFELSVENASADFEEDLLTRVAFLKKEIFLQDDLALSGAYQRLNALTAAISVAVSDFFKDKFSSSSSSSSEFIQNLRRGLADAYWPGRYELIAASGQILDGAHNPAGARALRLSLEEMFGAVPFVFIFACFENKDLESVLTQLLRPGDYLLNPRLEGERPFHRFEDIEAICSRLQVQARHFENIDAAGQYARRLIAAGDNLQITEETATGAAAKLKTFAKVAVVTGSFATVRQAKAALS